MNAIAAALREQMVKEEGKTKPAAKASAKPAAKAAGKPKPVAKDVLGNPVEAEVKAVVPEIIEVSKTEIQKAEDLRRGARTAYSRLQKSWFVFAKVVAEIHDSEAWASVGYASFKEYCVEEFKDLDYTTVSKFVKVVQSWGKVIEKKLEKDPQACLPAWDTCYTLTSSESKFPSDILPKLRKDVLDGKISARTMRQKVKEILEKEDNEKSKAVVDQMESDVEAKTSETKTKIESVKTFDEIEAMAEKLIVSTNNICEHLPVLTDSLAEGTRRTVKLAELFHEKLQPAVIKYLDAIEKACE